MCTADLPTYYCRPTDLVGRSAHVLGSLLPSIGGHFVLCKCLGLRIPKDYSQNTPRRDLEKTAAAKQTHQQQQAWENTFQTVDLP